jgi:hypothetical protein
MLPSHKARLRHNSFAAMIFVPDDRGQRKIEKTPVKILR